jgi:hypothetical protein
VDIFEKGRCGPGASVGTKGKHEYIKLFAGPITATRPGLYKMYRAYAQLYPEWANAEIIRVLTHGEATYVSGSKSSFVPKTNKISRMICTEPSLNMFIQLGIGEIIGDRLRSYLGINLEDQQTVNRLLARLGSRSQRYATIDLESASDSISLKMLTEYMPDWVVATLLEVRSPTTTLPGGERVQLNMVSTMGNGFTFPLQTAIFGCAVAAVYKHAGIALYRGRRPNFSVFGDDIICETQVFHRVTRLLGLLGFVVNSDKTFAEGPFRESCGYDWLNGQPVRGVYIKALNRSRDYAVAFNLLARWSAIHAIPLSNTLTWILRQVPRRDRLLVPPGESLDAGIHVPRSVSRSYSFPIDKNGIARYKAYVPKSRKVRIDRRSLSRSRIFYNLSGLFLCAIKGSLRGNALTEGTLGGFDRLDEFGQLWSSVEYGTVSRVTPNWDFPYGGWAIQPPRFASEHTKAWTRWKTVVEDLFLQHPYRNVD